jgi:hypothetical protein
VARLLGEQLCKHRSQLRGCQGLQQQTEADKQAYCCVIYVSSFSGQLFKGNSMMSGMIQQHSFAVIATVKRVFFQNQCADVREWFRPFTHATPASDPNTF